MAALPPLEHWEAALTQIYVLVYVEIRQAVPYPRVFPYSDCHPSVLESLMNDALVLLFVAAIVGLRVWGEIAYGKVLERQSPSTQFEVLQARGYPQP